MPVRGMGAIRGAIDEAKRQAQRGGWARYFRLKDGESAEVLFMGDPESEPFIVHEHSLKSGADFSSIQHVEDHCVPCYYLSTGDRRVGRPSPKGAFTLYDLRWQRKKKDMEKSAAEGQDRYTYEDLAEEEVTEKGKAKGFHIRRGKVMWKSSQQTLQAIDVVNAKAGLRCKACVKGKISRVGFTKPDGTRLSIADKSEAQIQGLLARGKAVEKLKCTGCDDPVRKSIFNSVVRITRAGSMKTTTYQLEILPDDVPEDVVELLDPDNKEGPKPFDFEKTLADPTPEEQSAEMKVRNPFGKSKKKSSDDDDEDEAEEYEEEDEEDYDADPFGDEDDEDEKPAKKKVAAKKKVTKRAVEEDDDEDEESEDDDDDPFSDDDDAEDEDEDDEPAPKKKLALKKKVVTKAPAKKTGGLKFGAKKVVTKKKPGRW